MQASSSRPMALAEKRRTSRDHQRLTDPQGSGLARLDDSDARQAVQGQLRIFGQDTDRCRDPGGYRHGPLGNPERLEHAGIKFTPENGGNARWK